MPLSIAYQPVVYNHDFPWFTMIHHHSPAFSWVNSLFNGPFPIKLLVSQVSSCPWNERLAGHRLPWLDARQRGGSAWSGVNYLSTRSFQDFWLVAWFWDVFEMFGCVFSQACAFQRKKYPLKFHGFRVFFFGMRGMHFLVTDPIKEEDWRNNAYTMRRWATITGQHLVRLENEPETPGPPGWSRCDDQWMHQGSGAPNCKRCKSVAIRKHQGLEIVYPLPGGWRWGRRRWRRWWRSRRGCGVTESRKGSMKNSMAGKYMDHTDMTWNIIWLSLSHILTDFFYSKKGCCPARLSRESCSLGSWMPCLSPELRKLRRMCPLQEGDEGPEKTPRWDFGRHMAAHFPVFGMVKGYFIKGMSQNLSENYRKKTS